MADVAVAPEIQQAPPPPEIPKKAEAIPIKEQFDLERKKVESDASQIRSALEKTVTDSPEVDLKPEQKQFGELSQELNNLNQETATELGLQEQPQLTLEQQEKDLEQYKDTEGKVEKIAVDKEVYFVHVTTPVIEGGQQNRFLREAVQWPDKVAFLVDRKPTVSTSTITRGEPRRNLWGGGIGAIVTGGRVEEAGVGDLESKATGIKSRESGRGTSESVEEYKKNLDRAISGSFENPWGEITKPEWNELMIGADPQVAGLFINLDQDGSMERSIICGYKNGKPVEVSYKEVFQQAENFGMPVFVFKKGIAYEANLNESGGIILRREISPSEMVKEKYQIPSEKRDQIAAQAQRSQNPSAFV